MRRPLATALAGMELHHRRRHVRNRIRRVRDEVTQGRDCFEPLCRCGLISPAEATALASAERAGNLEWCFKQLPTTSRVASGLGVRSLWKPSNR